MVDRTCNDYRWLTSFYFGSCNNEKRDIDPYNSLDDFLAAPVNSLRWGDNVESQKRSKFIFADIFSQSVAKYDVQLSPKEVYKTLLESNDQLSNQEIVDVLFTKAVWS